MRKQTKLGLMDVWVLGSVLVLLVMGVWLVFDASFAKTADAKWAGNDPWYFVKRQALFAAAGLFVMWLVSRIRLSKLLKITTPLLVMSVIMLIGVMVPGIGYRVNGALRWIKLGPISVQPSEIAKLALVLYLARLLAEQKNAVRRLDQRWLPPACIVGLISGLVFIEPDLGTAIAIVSVCFLMLFAAGARKIHLGGMLGLGTLFAIAAIKLEPYRMDRIRIWQHPWKYRYGDGYQVVHSLIALGTGGWHGVGLCEGREKTYIPAASTDFIFSTLAEELGLIGCLILLAAFIFFIYRGLDVARRSKSSYANLLAVGVTSMIGMQALINMAVVSASIPATGVPLPFISYGGSSLVLMLAGIGILLAVSRQTGEDMELGSKR